MEIIGIALMLVGLFIYLLPSYIAHRKNHRNFLPLLLVNIFFGFTGVIWFVCLIWALWNSKD